MTIRMLVTILVVFLMTGCAVQLPTNTAIPSYALPPSTTSDLAHYIKRQQALTKKQTAIYPLGTGVDAFVARLYLIEHANTSIDLQYYIYNSDTTGLQLSYMLWQAAERGVRVRLLLDDLKANSQDKRLQLLASHPNITIKLFNPFARRKLKAIDFAGDFKRLNRRMHNKSMTIDSIFTLVGGRNIGDEYFSASDDKDFGDFDLLAIGPIVSETNHQFDLYWNHALSYDLLTLEKSELSQAKQAKILAQWHKQIEQSNRNEQDYIAALRNSQLAQYIGSNSLPWQAGKAVLIYDDPDKVSGEQIENLLQKMQRTLALTSHNIVIISPYFVPRENGTAKLIELAKQGLSITILTNSLAATDVVAVHSGYAPYRKALLAAGIRLFEMKVSPDATPKTWQGSSHASLHAKSILFDEHTIFVGSFNLDPRSVYLNTEMGMLFNNPHFVTSVKQSLQSVLESHCYQVKLDNQNELYWFDAKTQTTYYSEPDASIWRKIGAWFFELLPIEEQL